MNVIKQNLICPESEMVFGISLTLPSQYFKTTNRLQPTTGFVQNFKQKIGHLPFTPTQTQTKNWYTPKDPYNCKYILLCKAIFLSYCNKVIILFEVLLVHEILKC